MNPLRILSSEVVGATTSAESNSAVMATGVRVVRVAPIVACHIAIGTDAEATTSSLYMPAGTVEYFSTKPGELVSVIASSDDGDVSITQMSG